MPPATGNAKADVDVYMTVLCKEIRDPPINMEADLAMVCTVIVRAVLPEGMDQMPFSFRVDNIETDLELRRARVAYAADDSRVRADVRTYSGVLPLRIKGVFSFFPYFIGVAGLTLQLADNETSTVKFQPRLRCDKFQPRKSLLTIRDSADLNHSNRLGLVSEVPVLYAPKPSKANSIHAGFYVFDPAASYLVQSILPFGLIFLLLFSQIGVDSEDFLLIITTLAVALMVWVPTVRKPKLVPVRGLMLDASDAFVSIIFIGLGIATYGHESLAWRQVGTWAAFAGFIVPILGVIKYNSMLSAIRQRCEVCDEFERSRCSSAPNVRGGDFMVGRLVEPFGVRDAANAPENLPAMMAQALSSVSRASTLSTPVATAESSVVGAAASAAGSML